jgi:hypothetical protein
MLGKVSLEERVGVDMMILLKQVRMQTDVIWRRTVSRNGSRVNMTKHSFFSTRCNTGH